MATTTLNFNREQLEALTDILMGAAYADDDFHGLEAEEIARILRDLIPDNEFALRMAKRSADFRAEAFELDASADRLHVTSAEERRAVLTLVARVTDADFTHDFAESDYIRKVGDAIGANPDEWEGLTVEEISIDVS